MHYIRTNYKGEKEKIFVSKLEYEQLSRINNTNIDYQRPKRKKSSLVLILLTLIVGPLSLFYVSKREAVKMLVLTIILFTVGYFYPRTKLFDDAWFWAAFISAFIGVYYVKKNNLQFEEGSDNNGKNIR